MSDEELGLIRQALRGDMASFEALLRIYEQRRFRFILTLARNLEDAEDCLQETLIQVYRALSGFRGQASLSTWLRRIAANTTRNRLRYQAGASSQRIALRMVRVASEPSCEIDERILGTESRALVRQALL